MGTEARLCKFDIYTPSDKVDLVSTYDSDDELVKIGRTDKNSSHSTTLISVEANQRIASPCLVVIICCLDAHQEPLVQE